MNEFDSFLISLQENGTAVLNSFIKYLGFEHHNIEYYSDTLAAAIVDDLKIVFSVTQSKGYFTVCDVHHNILDRAVFKRLNNDWKEIEYE